jgi:hypothetical protein
MSKHGFTAHGHHCCALAPLGERPNRVARCGGPGLCRDCQRSAAAIHGTTTDNHPENTCGRCGGPNVAWSAPSPLWNRVMRGDDISGTDLYGGIVCPTCFAVLAEKVGVADLWQMSAKRVHVPLQTVTPSGRVWNEQTWLWDAA